ncbi:hypothetical protein GCM10010254_58870 [Streptomyces chromofuscus]|nr:hypothetical protein GCM10010254_58870 [Streptomyces chromofuscus]
MGAFLVCAALAGCSAGGDATPAEQPRQAAPARTDSASGPETPAEFLALAEKAMAGETGWTFDVKGSEELLLPGQSSGATYAATVRRTTGEPWALHSTGTIRSSRGVAEPEEIYVVDGTGYVKEGAAAWAHGPLSDPGIADKVEDPVAELDTFQGYGDTATLAERDGQAELRVRVTSAALTAVRDQGVVQKALRELTPTLTRLRAAGVAAPESEITVERAEESIVLDSSTYQVTSHTFRCVLRIPYGERSIRYRQDVTVRNTGSYQGPIVLPEGVG